MNISELMKKLNLPSKTVMSDITKKDVLTMSDKELSDTFEKERAKVILTQNKLRSIRGDLKKKLERIYEENEDIKKQILALEHVPETKANLRRFREVNNRAKTLIERRQKARNQAYELSKELSMKYAQLENNINLLREEMMARVGRRKQEKIQGGMSSGLSDQAFNKTELKAGQQVEMEHTKSPTIAKEIAKDHLTEFPHYYKELAKLENKLKTEKRRIARDEA